MSKWTAKFVDLDGLWPDELTRINSTPLNSPGITRRVFRPGYGMGIYRYIQNKNDAALTVGAVASFVPAVTLTATATGTVTSFPDTGLTVNEYQYDLCICLDDAGGSGGTPEGTGGVIVENTATNVKIDADSPFGAAPVVSDTFQVMTNCKVVACATSDIQAEFAGVVQAASLTDDYWGWVQVTGRCSRVNLKDQITIAALQALIAETGVLTISSTSALNLLFGTAVHGVSNDAGRLDYCVADLYGYIPEYGNGSLVTT